MELIVGSFLLVSVCLVGHIGFVMAGYRPRSTTDSAGGTGS